MRAPPCASSPRRFVWLLWLALLTPLAQTAAAWHALSHPRPEAVAKPGDKQALHQTQCDLCLAAAALGSAAPTGRPPSLPRPSARHGLPDADSRPGWSLPPAQPYQSRAPPLALR